MASKETLYDVLVVPEDLDRRIAAAGGESFVRMFAANRFGRPVDEAVARDWVEVYCEPGASAHEPFVMGGYSDPAPVFKEAVVRFGEKAVDMPYGVADKQVNFFVEFRGCRFKDPTGRFKNRFKELLRIRPAIFVRDHTEVPPHRPVGEDEQPLEKPKKGVTGTQAGTRVEEW